jgi:hypothetical protein
MKREEHLVVREKGYFCRKQPWMGQGFLKYVCTTLMTLQANIAYSAECFFYLNVNERAAPVEPYAQL